MSLLLPILYIGANVLLFGTFSVVAIAQRNGMPAGRRVIAAFSIWFVLGVLMLLQLGRVAAHLHALQHASTAAPAVGISRTVPGASFTPQPRQPERAALATRTAVHRRLLQCAIRSPGPVASATRGTHQHPGHRAHHAAQGADPSIATAEVSA